MKSTRFRSPTSVVSALVVVLVAASPAAASLANLVPAVTGLADPLVENVGTLLTPLPGATARVEPARAPTGSTVFLVLSLDPSLPVGVAGIERVACRVTEPTGGVVRACDAPAARALRLADGSPREYAFPFAVGHSPGVHGVAFDLGDATVAFASFEAVDRASSGESSAGGAAVAPGPESGLAGAGSALVAAAGGPTRLVVVLAVATASVVALLAILRSREEASS